MNSEAENKDFSGPRKVAIVRVRDRFFVEVDSAVANLLSLTEGSILHQYVTDRGLLFVPQRSPSQVPTAADA
jgi:hypothetical protein